MKASRPTIDSAPTGTALRLLSLPEVSGWYMRFWLPIARHICCSGGPFIEPIFKPIAGFSAR